MYNDPSYYRPVASRRVDAQGREYFVTHNHVTGDALREERDDCCQAGPCELYMFRGIKWGYNNPKAALNYGLTGFLASVMGMFIFGNLTRAKDKEYPDFNWYIPPLASSVISTVVSGHIVLGGIAGYIRGKHRMQLTGAEITENIEARNPTGREGYQAF